MNKIGQEGLSGGVFAMECVHCSVYHLDHIHPTWWVDVLKYMTEADDDAPDVKLVVVPDGAWDCTYFESLSLADQIVLRYATFGFGVDDDLVRVMTSIWFDLAISKMRATTRQVGSNQFLADLDSLIESANTLRQERNRHERN